MKQAIIYSLKVWLTTIIVAPVIVVFLQRNPPRKFINYLDEYLWTVLGDLIFFIPPLFVFSIVTLIINRTSNTRIVKKMVIIGHVLLFFPLFWWLFTDFIIHISIFQDTQQMLIISAYLAVIALSTTFYKLKPITTALLNKLTV